MKTIIFLLSQATSFLMLFSLISPIASQTICNSDRCHCYNQQINCSAWQGPIPQDIPNNTVRLLINTSFINTVTSFPELPHLTQLGLEICVINSVDDGAFTNVNRSLTYLQMKNNFLTNITNNTFGRMARLTYLDLSFNLINHIDNDAFLGMPSLTILYLNGNRLAMLHVDLFRAIRPENMTTLWLNENPWHCFCELFDLIRFYRRVNNTRLDTVQPDCLEPRSVANQPWSVVVNQECQSGTTTLMLSAVSTSTGSSIDVGSEPAQTSSEGSSFIVILLIVVVAVLVISALIYGAYYFGKKKGMKGEEKPYEMKPSANRVVKEAGSKVGPSKRNCQSSGGKDSVYEFEA